MPKSSTLRSAKRVFILACIVLWIMVIGISLYVLNNGGHLTPKASETILAEGQVIDESGKGVGGAKVTINKEGINSYVYTDSEGKLSARNATDNTYNVEIEAEGYKSGTSSMTFTEGNKSFFIYTLEAAD